MAPDAELHLVKLGDEIGGYEVIDYLIDNNIDIVSLSWAHLAPAQVMGQGLSMRHLRVEGCRDTGYNIGRELRELHI
jgi:hypothetical protein